MFAYERTYQAFTCDSIQIIVLPLEDNKQVGLLLTCRYKPSRKPLQ